VVGEYLAGSRRDPIGEQLWLPVDPNHNIAGLTTSETAVIIVLLHDSLRLLLSIRDSTATVIFNNCCLPQPYESRIHLPTVYLGLSRGLTARINRIGGRLTVACVDSRGEILIGCVEAAECHIFIL
jgi:hypothetical protein